MASTRAWTSDSVRTRPRSIFRSAADGCDHEFGTQTHFFRKPLEPQIGFSRAVRVGDLIVVAGTAPVAGNGTTAGVGDPVVPGEPSILRPCLSDFGLGAARLSSAHG